METIVHEQSEAASRFFDNDYFEQNVRNVFLASTNAMETIVAASRFFCYFEQNVSDVFQNIY